MLTKNDLQQIRTVVQEEARTVVREELKPVKRKLNQVARDLYKIIGDFDTRIVENKREVNNLKQFVNYPQH